MRAPGSRKLLTSLRAMLAVLALVVPIYASPARASLMRAMSLPELEARADAIVVARVLATSASWDQAHRRIHTTVQIEIEEWWKGHGEGRLTLIQPGGTVGDIEMAVQGMPRFTPGERTLLFLRGTGHVQVVGMAQGKRTLQWDATGRRWFVDAPDGAGVVARDGSATRAAGPVRATLDELRRRVRSLAGEK